MNILFVADIIPYPPNTGIKIRTFNTLYQLGKEFGGNVHFVGFRNKSVMPDNEMVEEARSNLEGFCQSVTFLDIPSDRNQITRYTLMALSVLSSRPHRCLRYWSKVGKKKLRELISDEAIDAVHFDKSELLIYRNEVRIRPIFVTNHNVESKLMQDRSRFESTRLRKSFARLQAKKLEKWETEELAQVDGIVTCTELDANYFRDKLGIHVPARVIPNGVDTEHYCMKAMGKETDLLIIGAQNKDSTANFDATHFFMTAVWPKIMTKRPETNLKIVGRDPDPSIRRYESDNVSIMGFVEDEREVLWTSKLLLVPLRVGGGSRLKIITAMAAGLPVISTAIGAEGIDAKHEISILLGDSADELAELIFRGLDDGILRERIAVNARQVAQDKYGWGRLGDELRGFYSEVSSGKKINAN